MCGMQALRAWHTFRETNPGVTPEFTTLQMLLTVTYMGSRGEGPIQDASGIPNAPT